MPELNMDFPNLAEMLSNGERIKAARITNQHNRMIVDQNQKNQQLENQLAPMVANNDYNGAIQAAGQAGNLGQVQAMQQGAAGQQSSVTDTAKNHLEILLKASEYLAPAFYDIAKEKDPAQRINLSQMVIQQLAPQLDTLIPGWSQNAMNEIGNADPGRLQIFANRGMKVVDQARNELAKQAQDFSQTLDAAKFGQSQQAQQFGQGLDTAKFEQSQQAQQFDQGMAQKNYDYRASDDATKNAISAQTAAGAAQPNIMNLRKEWESLPENITWKKIIPTVYSVRDAQARDTRAADLNIIYGVSFLNDPNSVVRESESQMVMDTGSPAERFKGLFNYVVGGGRLTPKIRGELMDEFNSRVKGHENNYKAAKKHYESIITRAGLNPADIIPENMMDIGSTSKPIFQVNKNSGEKRVSNDGGRTWASQQGGQPHSRSQIQIQSAEPIIQTNKRTGQKRISRDGGVTWQITP